MVSALRFCECVTEVKEEKTDSWDGKSLYREHNRAGHLLGV